MIATLKLLLAAAMLTSAFRGSVDASDFFKCKIATFLERFDFKKDGKLDSDDFDIFVGQLQGLAKSHYSGPADQFDATEGAEIENAFRADKTYLNLPLDVKKGVKTFASLNDNCLFWVAKYRVVSAVLRGLDVNNNGFMEPKEFAIFLQAMGVAEKDCQASFDALDIDGDGEISIEEAFISLKGFFSRVTDTKSLSKLFFGPAIASCPF